jgi:non-ribosomal peptide synthetase component F
MDDLTYHLTYLTGQLRPPTTWAWWPHVEHRAKELAKDPALTDLPALLLAEYEKLRNASKTSGQKQSCITNQKEKANELHLDR